MLHLRLHACAHMANIEFVAFVATLLLLLPFGRAAPAAAATELGSNCTRECGGIKIPYPFGVEPRCFHATGFNLTCNTTGYSSPRLIIWLAGDQYVVTNISLEHSTMRFWPRREIKEPALVPEPEEEAVFNETTARSGWHLFNKQLVMDWEVGSHALYHCNISGV